jgi:hypothetical protein
MAEVRIFGEAERLGATFGGGGEGSVDVPIETRRSPMATEYTPGDEVPRSGIYKVTHDTNHKEPHEVTCIKGKIFPPCRNCHGAKFELVYAAKHIADHSAFYSG